MERERRENPFILKNIIFRGKWALNLSLLIKKYKFVGLKDCDEQNDNRFNQGADD